MFVLKTEPILPSSPPSLFVLPLFLIFNSPMHTTSNPNPNSKSVSGNKTKHIANMKSSTQLPLQVKLLIFGFFLAFLLLMFRSSFSPYQNNPLSSMAEIKSTAIWNKIPSPLVQALIHYSTSNITPQQTSKEISVSARVLDKKSPCNFLVFGLGHDSLLWSSLNYGGRTVFLDEDESWIKQIKQNFPDLEAYHVVYETKVRNAANLLRIGKEKDCTVVSDAENSKCQLMLKTLPSVVYELEWDLIMVDAPTGFHDDAPGRMGAIYTAGMMARNRKEGETDVFVHDVNREVEDKFSRALLCEGYMKKQEGLLRHFTIPSHIANPGRPFCPST
ncbi:glucuronoxylan 4-O-methyltransferase 1-like [Telopea speciosissima]|uniref:glucuronoxylan 4-O-methyltransferase 1-like n=1 Tax=Telopea speciosissima TaxID=54955 RepID=UPI001CC5911E|nr:glucuronoxylan 4-O-methyltransferase 1-like [Telopea speciosissima]